MGLGAWGLGLGTWGLGLGARGLGFGVRGLTIKRVVFAGISPRGASGDECSATDDPVFVLKVSSHSSATFPGGGGHFCGRVARLATSPGLRQPPPPLLEASPDSI